ncbi:hypothetical protein TELCIR_19554 [Teladorsagia circumcincta]|uniref:Uncharacterized protein n=1 Tax=Teladorsagia circumcincta TaxID=45464 RepID=A0A2G9TM29_TELCI|nr:hypothetical protein TELCIR_19554 [Teladorsagia circumcincta]
MYWKTEMEIQDSIAHELVQYTYLTQVSTWASRFHCTNMAAVVNSTFDYLDRYTSKRFRFVWMQLTC